MIFAPLFEIQVSHGYYADGRCPELAFEPAETTQALAHSHRLVVKPWPGGVRVFVGVDAQTSPQIPFRAGASLSFRLISTRPGLSRFTDLSARAGMGAPTYRNTSLAPGASGPLSLEDDLTARLGATTFANVEITGLEAMDPSTGPRVFDLGLASKVARWAYYVVTDVDTGTFTMVDSDPAPGATPLQFDASPPTATDPIAAALEQRYPSLRRLRFLSSAPITLRREPRPWLELHLDGLRQIGHLPNPSLGDYAAVETTVESVTHSEPTFFTLIRLMTQVA
ncbi:MAG: hypothetical protein AAGF11_00450 [Myxococcota bacterium]